MTIAELVLLVIAAAAGVAVIGVLLAAVWLSIAGDVEDEHWPMGLDEVPTLDVANHIGDSRPIR
jgi:hypothetical protein